MVSIIDIESIWAIIGLLIGIIIGIYIGYTLGYNWKKEKNGK